MTAYLKIENVGTCPPEGFTVLGPWSSRATCSSGSVAQSLTMGFGHCAKYSTVIGVRLHPHVFRHSFAKQFLADNGNDLVSLAQILGHENLNTTNRYSQKSEEQLAAGFGKGELVMLHRWRIK